MILWLSLFAMGTWSQAGADIEITIEDSHHETITVYDYESDRYIYVDITCRVTCTYETSLYGSGYESCDIRCDGA